MADDPINVKSLLQRTVNVESLIERTVNVESLIQGRVSSFNPLVTLTLNNIVTGTDPGEVLFDFTTSDPDGTVTQVELFRKESAESVFTAVGAPISSPPASGQISDTSVVAGTYEYKLRATDNDANETDSNIVAGIVIASANVIPYTVDFQTLPDGVIPSATSVNGFSGLCNAYNRAGGTVSQTSGQGIINTPVNADAAWFSGPITSDLLTGPVPGQFTVSFDIKINTITGTDQFDTLLHRSIIIAPSPPVPPNQTIGIAYFGTGAIAFRYTTTGGAFTDHVVHAGSMETGKLIRCSLVKGATNYAWSYDVFGVTANGFKTASRLISTVQQPLSAEHFALGDIFSIATKGNLTFDNIAVSSP